MVSQELNLNLQLEKLTKNHRLISKNFGGFLAEACSVCFDDQKHKSGTTLMIRGYLKGHAVITWKFKVDNTIRASHNDPEVATEYGAYAIALLLICESLNQTVIERARKGKGFDFWLGDSNAPLFQNKKKLEVSGIRNGQDSEVKRRMKEKVERIKKYPNNFDSFIVVVEFSAPLSLIEKI